MPHRTLMRIAGEPTHASLKALEKELAANLMAVPCPWGHNKGHLGLLQDPANYLQRNGEAFNIPANAPPAYPADLAGNATAGVRDAACTDNQTQLKAWKTLSFLASRCSGVNLHTIHELSLSWIPTAPDPF